MRTSIVVLTADGLALARRLRDARPGETRIIGPSCVVGQCSGLAPATTILFMTAEPGLYGWRGPLRLAFPEIWRDSDAIIAVMALAIVVRLAGPLAADKRRDPAIVVVDDAGRFAISALGGHGAGANELAREVAAILGALPIITTASDTRSLPAADRIGRDLGWRIECPENLTRVAAAIVRRQRVAVYQDAGSPDWWQPFGAWPEHFTRVASWDELDRLVPAAILAITDRVAPSRLAADRTVLYRPPTLVAGIGCKRGTTRESIDAFLEHVFAEHGLATGSLSALATVSLKADESGLVALARARDVPLIAFPPEELAGQPGIETPSEQVRARIGITAVAEAAALRAAGADRLLVPKQIGAGLTLAVARRSE